MAFSKEEQAAVWAAIDRAVDDLANWRPQGPDEEESHAKADEELEVAYAAMTREYPRG